MDSRHFERYVSATAFLGNRSLGNTYFEGNTGYSHYLQVNVLNFSILYTKEECVYVCVCVCVFTANKHILNKYSLKN